MKINTKQTLKTLKGETIKSDGDKNLTIGEAIGNILANSDSTGKLKLFILAQKFATQEDVEIDDADLALVKSTIEASKVSVLIVGQLLLLLENKQEASKK